MNTVSWIEVIYAKMANTTQRNDANVRCLLTGFVHVLVMLSAWTILNANAQGKCTVILTQYHCCTLSYVSSDERTVSFRVKKGLFITPYNRNLIDIISITSPHDDTDIIKFPVVDTARN